MKITQEVRDFAVKQNASADTFLGGGGAAQMEMGERFGEVGGQTYSPANV